MAEALAGLGVAANIAQFVATGISGLNLLYKFYHSGSGLIEEQEELDTLSRDIQYCSHILKEAAEFGKWKSQGLEQLLKESNSVAGELQDQLEKLKDGARKGNCFHRLKRAVRAIFKKGEIKRLADRLIRLRDQISSHLLVLSRYDEPCY